MKAAFLDSRQFHHCHSLFELTLLSNQPFYRTLRIERTRYRQSKIYNHIVSQIFCLTYQLPSKTLLLTIFTNPEILYLK